MTVDELARFERAADIDEGVNFGLRLSVITIFAGLVLSGLLLGCSTVTPGIVAAPTIATVKIVKVAGGDIIPGSLVSKYNGLIELGYGTPAHHILPKLKKNDGITVRPDGLIFMDEEHMRDFEAMNILYRSGIKP